MGLKPLKSTELCGGECSQSGGSSAAIRYLTEVTIPFHKQIESLFWQVVLPLRGDTYVNDDGLAVRRIFRLPDIDSCAAFFLKQSKNAARTRIAGEVRKEVSDFHFQA